VANISEEEVREALKGTVLENAPFVPVSSTTGKGLDKLIAELDNLAQSIEERSHDGISGCPLTACSLCKVTELWLLVP